MENKTTLYPQCPECHDDIDYGERLGIDFDDIYCFVYWSGSCPHCQRTFTFTETYKMVERSQL